MLHIPEQLEVRNGYLVDRQTRAILLAERDLRTDSRIDREAFLQAIADRYNAGEALAAMKGGAA